MSAVEDVWFVARIVLECLIPADPYAAPLYEERIVVLLARNEQAAWQKAETLGAAARHEYQNAYDQLVIWQLKDVLEVREVGRGPIKDGPEVYSAFIGTQQMALLRRMLQLRPERSSSVLRIGESKKCEGESTSTATPVGDSGCGSIP